MFQLPHNCSHLTRSKVMLKILQARLQQDMSHINNLRYAVDTSLRAESEEELKSFLMKVKEDSEKAGLTSIFQKLRSWHLVPSLHGK